MTTNKTKGRLAGIGPALIILLCWLGAMPSEAAAPPAIAVLYPNVREPYQGVFLKIISGIEEGLKAPVKRYPVTETDDLSDLERDLENDRTKAVVTLGRTGLTAAEKLRGKLPVVVGAVSTARGSSAPDFPGISLNPDPDILFRLAEAVGSGGHARHRRV